MNAKSLMRALRKGIFMSIETYVLLELILAIKIASLQAHHQDHFLINFMKLSGALFIAIALICIIYSLLSTAYRRRRPKVYYRIKLF